MSLGLTAERGGSRSRRSASTETDVRELWRRRSDDRDQDPVPDPTQTLRPDDGCYKSRRAVSTGTDYSVAVMSPSSLSLCEDNMEKRLSRGFSLSSRGSYSVVWRWSGHGPDSPNEQDSYGNGSWSGSDNLQDMMCPPLPGQVPVDPSEIAVAIEASAVIKSSTVSGKPTKSSKKRKGIGLFLQRLWKTIKRPLLCCCNSRAVDAVEPFVPPAHLDPDPDHSGVRPSNESFESLFTVGEMLGSGGFGKVYKGTRKFDGKRVAIKQIYKINNNRYLEIPGHPEPLVTEVALLMMMRQEPISPYVIQLYQWFEHPQKFTLIMEYPEPCESLLNFMVYNPNLDETTARVIMRQAVLAVQHCIDHAVFHNDVHAQNFLLKNNTLELKLIDFGCGQILSSDGYRSKTYIGLPHYCPPEVYTQPGFHAVPANVWHLGVLLYEMVNETCRPFRNKLEVIRDEVTFQNSFLSRDLLSLVEDLSSRLDPKPEIPPVLTGNSSRHSREIREQEHERLQDRKEVVTAVFD